MIFSTVKYTVRPDVSEDWAARSEAFNKATRAEEGNLFFDWARSLDNPNEFVLVEAWRDQAALEAHMKTDHMKAIIGELASVLTATPEIITAEVEGEGWTPLDLSAHTA